MRILLLLAASAILSHAQNDCSWGACYPPTDDLLLGRAHQLQASSTCGLTGSEVFCTPYQQRKMKCCPCDSRNPNSQLAHTVQDVVSTSGPDRWWQSKKETSPVTLQLNLNNLFQLDNLVLNFKGPRPSALVIERTLDNGKTWQPTLYMATNCQKAFPSVPTRVPLAMDQTYCYTLPPTDTNPYKDHTIEYSPLGQYAYVAAPKSQKIEDVSGLTGLRVRFTELGDVPHLPGRSLSRFYALKEMKVMGSCMCHGHANRCLPQGYSSNLLPSTIQVNAQCDCQHNTAGVNCERCADLYNDLPWRPAEEGNTHACKRCECNNHAQRCRFDWAVYDASGQRSGGVCENCMHHTTGPKCDQCAPGYQPNPRSRMDRPDACIRCICSAEGTVNGGRCDDSTGSCQCKVNVEGPRCDRCKPGYYGLSSSNPLGCTKCSCSPHGSLSDICDPSTGQCLCRPHFHGITCNVCVKGYWKLNMSETCKPCGCDATKSTTDSCDQLTGQCQCRSGFGGRTCTECPDNTYGDPLKGCQPCDCDANGTLPGVCDKQSGVCLCRLGVSGARCDSCSRDRCDSFPDCEMCPSCFFSLNAQRKNVSLVLLELASRLPSQSGGGADFGPRISYLEATLKVIQNSMSFSPITDTHDALSKLKKLRYQVDNDLSPLTKTPGLDSELDKLQDLLENFTLVYNAKKDATKNSISPNTGAFNTISYAYDNSTDATKKVEAGKNTIKESTGVREKTEDIQSKVQPANTRDLDKLNNSMASQPNLTPVAKQVCGSVHSKSCTPLQCEIGDLCTPGGDAPCEKGGKCVGALPLSKKADADANDVREGLNKLSGRITDAAEKLQKTQEITNQVRQSTEKLSSKLQQARDKLEDDLNETRSVVKELKDFLSDPSANLTHVQEVSDWILNAKLPPRLAGLKGKLQELKDLTANLPDSTAVLKEAEPQLDAAKKLLQDAQDARDTALGVKADVDGLLAGFTSVSPSLAELEHKLQDKMNVIETLNNNLTKAKDQLVPVEKALDDVATLIKPMKPQLEKLRDLLQDGGQQAEDARENAEKADKEAAAGNQNLLTLEKHLDHLKEKDVPGTDGETEPAGDRLNKLQQDAGALANTTQNMLQALDGKADSIQRLQDEIVQKSTNLEQLDVELKRLLKQLRKKADDLSTCQG